MCELGSSVAPHLDLVGIKDSILTVLPLQGGYNSYARFLVGCRDFDIRA
jgi:hypothetical protein